MSVSRRYGPRFCKTFPPGVPLSDRALSLPESILAVQSSVLCLPPAHDDRRWECGNLAFCARFPSRGGNRPVVSMAAPFPRPLTPVGAPSPASA